MCKLTFLNQTYPDNYNYIENLTILKVLKNVLTSFDAKYILDDWDKVLRKRQNNNN